jgi:hypothetical protein
MSQLEQWENNKFCQKSRKSASKTFQMIKQPYGEEAMGHRAVFKWHICFVQGRHSSEDEVHTGWSRTVTAELTIQATAMLVCASHF